MSMESIYEYGSRVGVWRILDLFHRTGLPLTVFAVGMAAERNPAVIEAMVADGHEICSHGYRWLDYQYVDIDTERAHLHQAIEALTRVAGSRPLGWYTGRTSAEHPARWSSRRAASSTTPTTTTTTCPTGPRSGSRPHLVVPYTLDANDMRFASPQGFNSGDQFFAYLRDTFDVLYAEGERTPRMMSVGLHCRLVGRPGRFAALVALRRPRDEPRPRVGQPQGRRRPPLARAPPVPRVAPCTACRRRSMAVSG